MPIKFRCNYCRQFLGISRAQAGGIVDCPTCGRSIRVPMLDGTLQPLPEPELNLQDAHLARALDELARLASGESAPDSHPVQVATVDDEDENEIPQPIPEPIPIEVPIPPTPIAINPPIQDDETIESLPGDLSATEQPARTTVPERNVLAELAAMAPAPIPETSEPQQATPTVRHNPQPRTSIPQATLMIALSFVAGMLFERFVKVLESVRSTPGNATAPAAIHDAKIDKASQLTGRISYKSADGTNQPDRGARVIVFPQQREGEAKLSVVGFRPADSETDAKVAAAALKALGGAMAIVDDSGQFQLDLPAGSYQLLVLSHFQPRDENQSTSPDLQKVLAIFFDKPAELLGRIKYEFGPLRIKGTGDVWDHSF